MRVFVFFALLAFALTATFHIEETKEEINEEINLEGQIEISRALECISALGGSAACIAAVSSAIYAFNLASALGALATCPSAVANIYNKCYSLVVKAVS